MRWPAEWEPHEAVWIGFPGTPAEWPVGLEEAQREVAAFTDAICDGGQGEKVILICRNQADFEIASRLVGPKIKVIIEPFGDIWLRDTGPSITINAGERRANNFGFNGWGEKFRMAGDEDIGKRLSQRAKIALTDHDWILEGGAIDGDGTGRLITTFQCVLNANRNSNISQNIVEKRLYDALGVNNVCWLTNGLKADHTDGHVDNLARFVAPGKIIIPEADTDDDPNGVVFEEAAEAAISAGLQVSRLPSVGKLEIDGQIVPASYMNFYIGNQVVVIPQYQASNDSIAVEKIQSLFPDHKVIGLPSMALLRGGGSFHCISQQIPAN